jgi:putative sporulation protein YyaC
MNASILRHEKLQDVVFVCIGTDRSTGDALGPLVGTYLTELGYTNVIGTIDDPCHAENVTQLVREIPKGKTIIAIDACLGLASNIGLIRYYDGGLRPGDGVGKDLGVVGDYSIKCNVNVAGFMEYFVLQNTRLSNVVRWAKEIVRDLVEVFPLHQLQVAASEEDYYERVR